ncbi:ankyrin repeat domain-containing protein 26-like [Erethizon dorsatum]
MEASENQYGATVATAVDDNGGLTQQRKSGETDNQQFPTKKKEEHDGSEPALPLRKVKKNENEQWSSTESVISPVFKKADSLSGGLLQVKSGRKLHDTDEDEGRSTKRTSNEKSKVKKKISAVGDCADLSQSSETPSEESPLPYPKDETILLLFIRFRMECKGKFTKLEKKVRGLQKELTETKDVKSQLEDERKQRERELGNLRFALKQEKEKRKNVYQLYETLKEQLRKKEEQYYQEVEARRRLEISLRTLDMELKTVRSKLSQLEEAQDRHTEAVRRAEKMQEYLQKLELENSRLNVKIKKQAGKIEHLQKNLCEDDKEQLKKLTEITQSLECTLDQVKKKNNELEKELIGLKRHFKMMETKFNEQENGEFCFHGDLKSSEFETDNPINPLIHKIDDPAAKLETTSSKCRHVDQNNQFLHQELLMKTMQKKCETLEEDKKKLEQEVVNLKSHVENVVVEQVEQYKQEIKERARQELLENLKQVNLFLQTQAASQEHLEQLRECNNASVRSQMELRIKDLESELSEMKTQQDDKKTQLETYKQLYTEEFRTRESLSSKLNKANKRLEKAQTKLLVEKQKSRYLRSTFSTRPVLECPCVGNLNHSLALHRSFLPRENLVVRTLNPQPANDSLENYLMKKRRELEDSITRELREATAELDAFEVPSRRSARNSSQDRISEASQEYMEILRRRYRM